MPKQVCPGAAGARSSAQTGLAPDYLVASEQLSTAPARSSQKSVGRSWVARSRPNMRSTSGSRYRALAHLLIWQLSSVAYATEAILGVLILASSLAFKHDPDCDWHRRPASDCRYHTSRRFILPMVRARTSSRRRKYTGTLPSLTAPGASLLIDYTLTVAVSGVSAGVAAITSAAPSLRPWRVEICVAFVGLIILGNLRGIHVKVARSLQALPTYLFILSVAVLIFLGVFRSLTGGDAWRSMPRENIGAVGVSVFLICGRSRLAARP